MRASRWIVGSLLAALAVGALAGRPGGARADEPGPAKPAAAGEAMFPFVLPWDDASPGVTNVAAWLDRPAGKQGPVRAGADGHLHLGSEQGPRLRLFGVNVCFAANLPTEEQAGKIAARLARFGINAVRFHHADMNTFPRGLRARGAARTGELDPEALERLDAFLFHLKEQGIYTDLNLLVSRPFRKADGLAEEVEKMPWKEQHVLGFFHEPALRLQKEYARTLLTHRNRRTGLTYAEDPAVAIVEINNENGLVHAWLGGEVDRMPEVFRRDLQGQWNAWLKKKYGSTEALAKAWGVKDRPLGEEMLVAPPAMRPAWTLERHGQAEARLVPTEGPAGPARAVRVEVTRPGAEAWHVQYQRAGLKVTAEEPYTLSFRARADRELTVTVGLNEAHEPWQPLAATQTLKLTPQWQEFRFTLVPARTDSNARVIFGGLGREKAAVDLAGVSLRPGGAVGLERGERLEDGTLAAVLRSRFGERTAAGQRDWLRFLWETEDAYWQSMYRLLKDEIKVAGVVVGTIVGCSTPNLMARLDAVDTHAYWQHPHFPRRPWDSEDWTVPNKSMVNDRGGTLPGLALRRVAGKPHLVTEYNHPAPNTYAAEGMLLLAAYAALQDWDGLFAFAWSHNGDWDSRRIASFFDIDQHPLKIATLPAAAALFLRGDVRAARQVVEAGLSPEQEIDLLRHAHAWDLVHARHVGVAPVTALVHRVALRVGPAAADVKPAPDNGLGKKSVWTSDTGELVWDLSRPGQGVVTVKTPRSKALIGHARGEAFDLGGLTVQPGPTLLDGWCAVTATVTEGDLAKGPARLLVTACGLAENTGMVWKSPARDSVGRQWGRAPSRVEGVPVRLVLTRPAAGVRAWALDERGQRRQALSVRASGPGAAAVELGPDSRTLWYELELP